MKKQSKVLVVGHPFNKTTGGGVTITNLFSLFERDNIALISIMDKVIHNDFDICNTVYVAGKEDVATPIIFRPFIRNNKSGIITKETINKKETKFQKGVFNKIIYKVFYNLFLKINFLFDLHFIYYKVNLSNKTIQWIKEFNPDVIYSHLSIMHNIQLVEQINKHLKIPIVIHTFDDWPKLKSIGIFSFYWQKKLEALFEIILKKTSALICISDDMKKEYRIRYNIDAVVFHNPINIDAISNTSKKKIHNNKTIRLIYTGRIAFSNMDSIYDVCKAVNRLCEEDLKVEFLIYSPFKDQKTFKKRHLSDAVRLCEPVSNDVIPEILSTADILVLPLDFDERSIKYTKLSWPTKASEYMASGKPILLYAPDKVAIVKHAILYNWAYIVNKRSVNELVKSIRNLSHNIDLQHQISKNAKMYAVENFDIKKNAKEFYNLINSI